MTQLVSDSAKVEISKRILELIRAVCISNWNSEPHHQQQNPAKRRYQIIKRMTNTLLDRSGSPASTWLLAITYVCFILNHTYCNAIISVPIQQFTGSTGDISSLLRFS